MPTLVDDFLENPTLPLVTIRCAPFHHAHSGACVILGDAAHAIVPFYGQGCNAAFEDVRILGELLQAQGVEAVPAGGASGTGATGGGESRFRSVCEDFTRLRKRNADAIAELALEHYADMGVHTLSPLFLLRRAAENAVGWLLSGRYQSEYHMVSFSSIPYADARERAVANDLMIERLTTMGLLGGALGLAGGVWTLLRPPARG
jgi:kynurenine 3-monooxygenase